MELIYTLDIIGTFVFAISGMLTAANKRFDLFGGFVIAFITAVGGGSVRDMLIGATPVGWMQDLNYLIAIGCGASFGYLFQHYIYKLRRTMFLFDTIGIGLFTILGLTKTLDFGVSPVIAVMMGTVSAVFGGVIRDTLCNIEPLIFRSEIYATACLAGAVLFLALQWAGLAYDYSVMSTVLFIIALRIGAVRYHWGLPEADRAAKPSVDK